MRALQESLLLQVRQGPLHGAAVELQVLSEAPLDEEALRAAIGKTGYEVQGVSARPYEKKGLFGFLKK